MFYKFLIIIFVFFISNNSISKNCYKEDYVNFVSDIIGCVAVNFHLEKSATTNLTNKEKLIVFIHGDKLDSKNIYFEKFASKFISKNSIVVSITRPGWTNIKNHKSGGKKNISNGDNYVPKQDVDPIYRVIKKLKKKYKTKDTIVIGHSGGAAITGILFGRFKKLIDSAILISCPCIVPAWRKNYFNAVLKNSREKICIPKFKSHSPHEYIKKINPKLNIYIFVGTQDKNTLPIFSIKYHELLIKNQKKSELFLMDGGHMNILDNLELENSIKKIIEIS